MLQTDAQFPAIGSNDKGVVQNKDGSYDIYFGPEPPTGLESNWIETGEDFFLLFRLYGPETKDFYQTWMLGDLEKVE